MQPLLHIEEFIRLFPFTPNADLKRLLNYSASKIARLAKKYKLKKDHLYLSKLQSKRAMGHTLSNEAKDKIRSSRLGKKMKPETIQKILQTKINNGNVIKGERHPNWKGGKPWLRFKDPEYIKWRNSVLERDNYICQDCKTQCKKYEKGLAAHHIKSYKDYPELRFDINNGLTLCRKCHMTLHGRAPLPKEPISCACGCGTMIPPFDKYGRARERVNHHTKGLAKPESMKAKLSEQRTGKKLSEEHKLKIKEGLAKSNKRIGRPSS